MAIGRYIDLGNPVADHPLNAGLVAWWLALPNLAGGLTLFDLKGRHHGALTNGPTWAPSSGPFQNTAPFWCVDFDGSDDVVEVSDHSDLKPAQFSITANFRADTVSDYDGIIGKTTNDTWSSGYGMFFEGGALKFFVDSWNTNVAFTGAISAGEWYHAAGTYDEANVRIYLEGDEGTADPYSTAVTHSANAFQIGKLNGAVGTNYTFDGRVGEMRFYNRALPATDVAAYHDQANRGHPETLRRWSRKAFLFGETTPAVPGGDAVPQVWMQYRRRFAG